MFKTISNCDLLEIHKIETFNFITPWTINQFSAYIKDESSINVLYENEMKIAGYIFGQIIDNVYHLYKISVVPFLKNQGIATQLLDFLINESKELNLTAIYLEVNASNKFAIKLYSKFGFVNIAVRKNYYQNNEDAILYNLIL
tara:strand:- start:504 stop:932 length:429 start_codon:yes stop_codon:yes gene_type:complete